MESTLPFGTFVLNQAERSGEVGELAKAAKADRLFARAKTLKDASALLNKNMAPPEWHDALEDLHHEWRNA